MAFVKLDTGILASTLWVERECREVFITALLMAHPIEIMEPTETIKIGALEKDDFVVPAGWYGFVPAAGPGIVRTALVDREAGMAALGRLAGPDPDSRSKEFGGRRMVRVDGGFIILNFIKYRDKDASTADRSKRWRERQKEKRAAENQHATVTTTRVTNVATRVTRHQAEAEAEAGKPLKTIPKAPRASGAGKSVETWNAYSTAYQNRYGVPPVRNTKINSQLCKLVEALGAEEAPQVAAFYLTHNGGLYMSSGHCTELLVRDAGKLRTEWVTGRKVTKLEIKSREQVDGLTAQIARVGATIEEERQLAAP